VIARLTNGSFVIVWESNGQDGSLYGVYGQRYASSGLRVGGAFRVNATTANVQRWPSIAPLKSGGFVVTWTSLQDPGGSYGVYGRRFTAAGAALGGEFPVNTYKPNTQQSSSVAGLADGGFAVTWMSSGQDGSTWGVYGQRFAASGAIAGVEFPVNTFKTGAQSYPSVAGLVAGGFVVAWQSAGEDGSGNGVYFRRYLPSGAAAGGELRANTHTPSDQLDPSVAALAGGTFVVAWTSAGQDGSGGGIFAQRFTAAGVKSGAEFGVNSYKPGNQSEAALAALTGGGFAASWTSFGQDGSGKGVYAQRYSAGGVLVGNEFRVNAYGTGNQSQSSTAGLAANGLGVAWTSAGQDGSSDGVYAMRFSP
jgi:hypothetical protein